MHIPPPQNGDPAVERRPGATRRPFATAQWRQSTARPHRRPGRVALVDILAARSQSPTIPPCRLSTSSCSPPARAPASEGRYRSSSPRSPAGRSWSTRSRLSTAIRASTRSTSSCRRSESRACETGCTVRTGASSARSSRAAPHGGRARPSAWRRSLTTTPGSSSTTPCGQPFRTGSSTGASRHWRAANAVGVAVPASDTIVEVGADGLVSRVPDRRRVFACQTPQGFRAGVLREAHRRFAAEPSPALHVTDDCGLVSHYELAPDPDGRGGARQSQDHLRRGSRLGRGSSRRPRSRKLGRLTCIFRQLC